MRGFFCVCCSQTCDTLNLYFLHHHWNWSSPATLIHIHTQATTRIRNSYRFRGLSMWSVINSWGLWFLFFNGRGSYPWREKAHPSHLLSRWGWLTWGVWLNGLMINGVVYRKESGDCATFSHPGSVTTGTVRWMGRWSSWIRVPCRDQCANEPVRFRTVWLLLDFCNKTPIGF